MDDPLRERVRRAQQHRLAESELVRLLVDLKRALRVRVVSSAQVIPIITGHIEKSDALLAELQPQISSEPATETLEAYFCANCKRSFGRYDFAIHRRDRLCRPRTE